MVDVVDTLAFALLCDGLGILGTVAECSADSCTVQFLHLAPWVGEENLSPCGNHISWGAVRCAVEGSSWVHDNRPLSCYPENAVPFHL